MIRVKRLSDGKIFTTNTLNQSVIKMKVDCYFIEFVVVEKGAAYLYESTIIVAKDGVTLDELEDGQELGEML